MVEKLEGLDCDLSLLQIVRRHLAKSEDNGVPYKGIYKVRFDQGAIDRLPDNSGPPDSLL